MSEMTNKTQPSEAFGYAVVGFFLVLIGGSLLGNMNEDPAIFRTGGLIFGTSGLYLLLVGAVARGIEVAAGRC